MSACVAEAANTLVEPMATGVTGQDDAYNIYYNSPGCRSPGCGLAYICLQSRLIGYLVSYTVQFLECVSIVHPSQINQSSLEQHDGSLHPGKILPHPDQCPHPNCLHPTH